MLVLSEGFFRWCRRRTFSFFPRFDTRFRFRAAVLEAVGFIAGLNDVAMMRESVQQRRGELGITEHAAPFREGQVRRNDHTGAFVDLRQQVKQQSPAGL